MVTICYPPCRSPPSPHCPRHLEISCGLFAKSMRGKGPLTLSGPQFPPTDNGIITAVTPAPPSLL